jgi:hypothetical protein
MSDFIGEIAVVCFDESKMRFVAYSLLKLQSTKQRVKKEFSLGQALRQRLQGALGEVLYI